MPSPQYLWNNTDNNPNTMTDSKYFTTTKKGEIFELKSELNNDKKEKKKEAVKKVIASMTVGKDVSALFPDVVNCMQTDNLELKKLVYLYLMNYAKSQPDMAIMAVNTFVKVTRLLCFPTTTGYIISSAIILGSTTYIGISPIQWIRVALKCRCVYVLHHSPYQLASSVVVADDPCFVCPLKVNQLMYHLLDFNPREKGYRVPFLLSHVNAPWAFIIYGNVFVQSWQITHFLL